MSLSLPALLQPAPRPVTLALLGDVMLGRGLERARAGEDWEESLAFLAPELQSADLALANLESPLTSASSVSPGYDLRANPETVRALASSGLDILSLANNHILDGGAQGLEETRQVLQAENLTPLGPQPVLVWRNVGGQRLAFLALNDISEPVELADASRAVREARAAGGTVIVSIHWGIEYQPGINSRQQAIAQALADAGALIIWGHHPHVLQPVAWVQGSHQLHPPALVAYSLGNTLFDQVTPPDVRRSALLLVTLDPTGVQSVRAIPFSIDPKSGRVIQASPSEAQRVFQRLRDLVKP